MYYLYCRSGKLIFSFNNGTLWHSGSSRYWWDVSIVKVRSHALIYTSELSREWFSIFIFTWHSSGLVWWLDCQINFIHRASRCLYYFNLNNSSVQGSEHWNKTKEHLPTMIHFTWHHKYIVCFRFASLFNQFLSIRISAQKNNKTLFRFQEFCSALETNWVSIQSIECTPKLSTPSNNRAQHEGSFRRTSSF